MKIDFQGKNTVILTGAGISSESGLKTFRDANGLWEGYRIEDVATPEAFMANPEMVHKFYNMRRQQLLTVQPNSAHFALAKFEEIHANDFLIITQNVDDLHERAGSKNVLHMHGELFKVRDLITGEIFPWKDNLSIKTPHPHNGIPGNLRPHICWFGEVPFFMEEIESALSKADIFIAIGTSGLVYPAAGFVNWVPKNCYKSLINKDEADNNGFFDEFISGRATDIVPELFL